MEAVRRLGFDTLLRERLDAGVPVLGICLGMQLLFEGTTELGGAEGLGLLEGQVDALDADGLKVPQIGWNPVSWRRGTPLRKDPSHPCALYHRDSFAPPPPPREGVGGTATHRNEV